MTLTDEQLRAIDEYLADWWHAVTHREGRDWKEKVPAAPIDLMQLAALHHPNGKTRRFALGVLDHEANDESTDIFRQALKDPAPVVRLNALHGLSCERCRVGEICAEDVVTALIEVLASDESPKVRHASLFPLILLVSRDQRVQPAFARAAEVDPDPLIRVAAAEARDGNYRRVKTRKALRRSGSRQTQVGVGALVEGRRPV